MSLLKRVIVLFLITCFPVFAALGPGTQAPDFTLKDADDKSYILSEMRGKVVILLIGTRGAKKEGDKWLSAIYKDYGQDKNINCYLMADLRGLPFFVTKSIVKWGVKREKMPFKTLLDWKGEVAKKYEATKNVPNLFIIDRHGKIVYSYSGNLSDKTYSKFQHELNSILATTISKQYHELFRLYKKIIWNIILHTFRLFLLLTFQILI